MTPEDIRYFDKNFKMIREELQNIKRTQAVLMARTTPVIDENKI
jgi:hypothetical protein